MSEPLLVAFGARIAEFLARHAGLVRHATLNGGLVRELDDMTRRGARGQWLHQQDFETGSISAGLRNKALSDEAL